MAQRFYFPREQTFTNLGAVGIGWRLFTYETGTTTPKATYSNVALTSANANPASGATTGNQVSDSSGRFGDIFVSNLADYKAVLKDNLDNTIWTTDPVDPKTFTLADFDPAPVSFWGTTTGTSTAYELAADPTQTAYSSNSVFYIKFHTACGASPTLNIDDLGVLNLKKRDGAGTKTALEASDVLANYKYAIENDGTDLVVLNPEIQSVVKTNKLIIPLISTLTIASGVITVTGTNHAVDTEAAAATDNLDTINGGLSQQILILKSANDARDIVITSGVGNIINPEGLSIVLKDTDDNVVLKYDGSNWIVISYSNQSSSPKLLLSQTASASTQLDFIDLATTYSGYKTYEFRLINILPATNSVILKARFSTDNGSTFLSTNYVGGAVGGSPVDGPTGHTSATDGISITGQLGGWEISNAANNSVDGVVTLQQPSNASSYKSIRKYITYDNVSGNYTYMVGNGRYEGATTAVNAIRFLMTSGNIASGTIEMWGYK
jgi:hypothetical protein